MGDIAKCGHCANVEGGPGQMIVLAGDGVRA